MKKILLSGSLALLFLPALALAAGTDVTITTSAIFSVGGIELDLNGTNATISSVTVDASSMSIVVDSGSSVSITAPGRNIMALSGGDGITSQALCSDSASRFTLSGATTATTVTITPSSTLCSSTAATTGSGGGNGPIASGGGGGGSYTPPPASGDSPAITALRLQIQALLTQIAAMQGGANPNANAFANANANASFKRNLTIGSIGADVTALQVYLNTHGYVIVSSGPGSPGNETAKFGAFTRAALAKFQKAVGLTPPAGYFGAKTRAYIAAHP